MINRMSEHGFTYLRIGIAETNNVYFFLAYIKRITLKN